MMRREGLARARAITRNKLARAPHGRSYLLPRVFYTLHRVHFSGGRRSSVDDFSSPFMEYASTDAARPVVVRVVSIADLEAGNRVPGGRLSNTICIPQLVWCKSCFGGSVICTNGQHSALLHPSPSVRETLADR